MAMLAEPRRKQRIGPNPRGKLFTEDDENRGRQMLMKMGWKNGDGLGAQRQGMSEPIRPKINTESRGLGFDKKHDPWIAHNEEFEQLLKSLNDNVGEKRDDVSENSSNSGLETKSKSSRSRIHYHKFVKNKDLSRASVQDMSCIFGKSIDKLGKTFDEDSKPQEIEINLQPKVEPSDENEVHDKYEVKKKKKKKKKRDKKMEDRNDEEPSSVELDQEIQPEEVSNVEEGSELPNYEIKKKKKKKHRDTVDLLDSHSIEKSEDTDALTTITKKEDEVLEENVSNKKKKKSKKHRRNEVVDDHCLNNEDAITTTEIPPVEDNPGLEVEVKSKKKKSKKRKREVEEEQEDNCNSTDADQLHITAEINIQVEQPLKKKKKKSKKPESSHEQEASSSDSNGKDNDKAEAETFGSMQFINRGSIEDYFKAKRLQMLNRTMAK